MARSRSELRKLQHYDDADSIGRALRLAERRGDYDAQLALLRRHPERPTWTASLEVPFSYVTVIWKGVSLLWGVKVACAFAADCVERVIPIWEEYTSEDRRPQEAIRATRAWVRGEGEYHSMQNAGEALPAYTPNVAAHWVAWAAHYATRTHAWNAANKAIDAAGWYAPSRKRRGDTEKRIVRAQERKWQRERLACYLLGEITSGL